MAQAYYADGASGKSAKLTEALHQALDLAEANGVDFDEYDRDGDKVIDGIGFLHSCLLYTSPSPRDQRGSRMPSSA